MKTSETAHGSKQSGHGRVVHDDIGGANGRVLVLRQEEGLEPGAEAEAGLPHECVLQHNDVGKQKGGPHKEIQEVFVVAKPDASDNPRAMVVHAQEASVAHAAVVRARRLVAVALAAAH